MTNSKHSDIQPVTITNWAPIAGNWSFENNSAQYLSPTKQSAMPYGLALSDVKLRDGLVSSEITFENMEDTTGGIVVGFHSESAGYIMAQLGAYNYAYSLSEYEPSVGWRAIATAGSIGNLIKNKAYSVNITQKGQNIKMVVNNVPIFNHIISRPLPGNQVGLFAWGKTPVHFKQIIAQRERPRAFVAMPFSEPFETLYREVIQPETDALGFNVIKIDELSGPGIIFEDIKREIAEAKVVIAEITAPNQNVFYELGYAHALNKPTILLAQRGKELPFDIRSYRVIFYEDTIGGKPIVENNIRKHLHSILQDL